MATYTMRPDLETAEAEIIRDFGDLYRDYGHDLAILRQLRSIGFQPNSIFDVGSSDGIWSAMANRVYPDARFDLFEPLSKISDEYQKSLHEERWLSSMLASGRVHIHPVALGAKSGNCQMTVYQHAVGSTSLKLDYEPEEAKKIEVPMYSLDDITRSKRLPAPSLIKLDTQGSELDILHGANSLLRHVDFVLCECWLFKGYGSKTPLWIEVANYLAERGLFIYDMGWAYRRPNDQRVATIDIVFMRHNLSYSPLNGYNLKALT